MHTMHTPLTEPGKWRAEADIYYMRWNWLTNPDRAGRLANQSRLGPIRRNKTKRLVKRGHAAMDGLRKVMHFQVISQIDCV